jgi:hypothetical protein
VENFSSNGQPPPPEPTADTAEAAPLVRVVEDFSTGNRPAVLSRADLRKGRLIGPGQNADSVIVRIGGQDETVFCCNVFQGRRSLDGLLKIVRVGKDQYEIQPASPPAPHKEKADADYFMDDGYLCCSGPNPGDPFVYLANFVARIVEVTKRHDAAEVKTRYRIRAKHAVSGRVEEIEVEADQEFPRLHWIYNLGPEFRILNSDQPGHRRVGGRAS